MLKNFFAQIKTILLYAIIGLIIIAVSVAAALFALRMEKQPETLEKQVLNAHDYTVTIETPFTMTLDKGFNVEPEVLFYVKNTKAFFGSNEKLSLHVYSITYKTELFKDNWVPNIDNMADVSINTLKKNPSLKNIATEKRKITAAGTNAIFVTITYKKGMDNMVQKILHIPTKTSTWSFKAIFKDSPKLANTVTSMFDSIVLNLNKQGESERD